MMLVLLSKLSVSCFIVNEILIYRTDILDLFKNKFSCVELFHK